MKAPELSDDEIKAPCPSSQPQDKLGEDEPLPQVTWRQIGWSLANPQPPVLAPGSRPWKKPPLTFCHHAQGLKISVIVLKAPKESVIMVKAPESSVIMLKAPKVGTPRGKDNPTTPRKDRHRRPQVGTSRSKNDPTTTRKERH